MSKRTAPKLKTQLWKDESRPGMVFARIAYRDFHFEPHFHDHYVILLVERGVNEGKRARENYRVPMGEMLLLRPGETHTGNSLQGRALQYLAFYPDASLFNDYWEKSGHRKKDMCRLELTYRKKGLNQAFLRLYQSFAQTQDEPLLKEEALLEFYQELAESQTQCPGQTKDPIRDSQSYHRALTYLQGRFDESFSLDELATAARVSPFHLIKLFRKHSGMTPFGYLRSFRVERAKDFIQQGHSLTEVAYRSGFYDQSHFIKSFKQHTGFLPSDFLVRT